MTSVRPTKAMNMPMAVQFVSCCSTWPLMASAKAEDESAERKAAERMP